MNTSPSETPVVDPLADMLTFQLRRAAAAVALRLGRELEQFGLTPSDAMLLILIGTNPGITQSDIARVHNSQRANLVPLIAKLSRLGAVERHSGRGRAIGLRLTALGQALRCAAQATFDQVEAHLRGDKTEGDLVAAGTLLNGLTYAACMMPPALAKPGDPPVPADLQGIASRD